VLARGGPCTSNTATRTDAAAWRVARPLTPPAAAPGSGPGCLLRARGGSLQRHRLSQRVVDDCPRCGHFQGDAERIAASLAGRYWPPDATQLPWVQHAYPP